MKNINDLKPGVPVILADGLFPENSIALEFIDASPLIICCDGAAVKLFQYGRNPDLIVGDMDSLPDDLKRKWDGIISTSEDQCTNDFTKAVAKALELNLTDVAVLGITGLREDHTLGNIGLLVEHGSKLNIQAITDYGTFVPIYSSTKFNSFVGQQVSIFSITGNSCITSENLKYPLANMQLSNWWMGTLNESITNSFTLRYEHGGLVVFRTHPQK